MTIEGLMDASIPVERRTKETLLMDDLGSVASNFTYQATFDNRSQIDSSANSTRKNSQNAIERKESHFTKQESVTYHERSTSGRQDDSSVSSLSADVMSIPGNGERGRSRSPRPKVSAEARARWAMLKSLAGVSRDDETVEEVETDIRTEENQITLTSNGRDSEAPVAAGLKPLLLGDPSNDNASMELFLSRLEHDPHIDGRALQEGLQASGLRRGNSQRDQQVRDRSRRAHGLESKIQTETPWIGDRARADAERLFQKGEEEASYDPRLISSSGYASEANLLVGSSKTARAIKSGEHNLGHHVQDAWQDVHKREQALETWLESAIKDGERDLRTLGIQRDIQHIQHDLKSGVIGATRLTENSLSGTDIEKGVQRGERNLKVDPHKLQGESLMSDLQEGEHGLKTGFDHAAGVVEKLSPSVDIRHDVRKGDEALKGALERTGQRIEKMMPALGLAKSSQKDAQDLSIDVQQDVRLAKKEIRGLEGRNLEQGIRTGVQDLTKTLQEGIKLANRGLGTLEGRGLGDERRHPGSGNAVADLEMSAMIHLQQDGHALADGAYDLTHSNDQQVDKGQQLAEKGVRMGEAAAGTAWRAPQAPKGHSPRLDGQGPVNRIHGNLTDPHESSVPQRPTVAHRTPAPYQPTAAHKSLSSHRPSVPQLPNIPQKAQDARHPTSPDYNLASHQTNTPQQASPARRGLPPPQQPAVQRQPTPHELSNPYPATPPQQRSAFQQRLAPQQAPTPWKIPNTPHNYPQQQHLAPQQSPSSHPPFVPLRPIVQPALAPEPRKSGQSYPSNNDQQLRPSPPSTGSRALSLSASGVSRKPMPASPSSTQAQHHKIQRPGQDNIPGAPQQPSPNEMGLRHCQPPTQPPRSLADQQNRGQGSVQSQPQPNPTNQPNRNRHDSLPNQPQPQLLHADVEPSPRISSPNLEPYPSIPRPMTGNQRAQGPTRSVNPQEEAGSKGAQRKDATVIEHSKHSRQGDAVRADQGIDVPQGNSQGDGQHETMAGHGGTMKSPRDIEKEDKTQGESADPPIKELDPLGSHDVKSPSPHEADTPCQQEGHETESCPHQGSSCTNASETQHTTHCEVYEKQHPSAVAGVQNMINMFKARSQASIDLSAGCPGFIDRKWSQSFREIPY